MRLGANSGSERREPGAKSCRTIFKTKRMRLGNSEPKGVSQEQNLAEIRPKYGNRDYQHKALTVLKKSIRLGANSGTERREPGSQTRRNLEILITSIRH